MTKMQAESNTDKARAMLAWLLMFSSEMKPQDQLFNLKTVQAAIQTMPGRRGEESLSEEEQLVLGTLNDIIEGYRLNNVIDPRDALEPGDQRLLLMDDGIRDDLIAAENNICDGLTHVIFHMNQRERIYRESMLNIQVRPVADGFCVMQNHLGGWSPYDTLRSLNESFPAVFPTEEKAEWLLIKCRRDYCNARFKAVGAALDPEPEDE